MIANLLTTTQNQILFAEVGAETWFPVSCSAKINIRPTELFPSVNYALFFMLLLTLSCSPNKTAQKLAEENQDQPVKIIFETDMGNDIDDALALDMLYKYSDQNKVEILAVNVNKNNQYAARFVDIMNTWYGYPDIPIGQVVNGADSEGDAKNYAQATWEHQIDDKPAFTGTLPENANIPDAVDVYREILVGQPDGSVTIVSVGFSTNIARLLDTPADAFSGLSGKELIEKKVKLLSIMAGNFDDKPMKEYNVLIDTPAAKKVFEGWPTEIVASPWELGIQIEYPASSIQNDFTWTDHHPLVVAYENYMPMPYDRPSWDLTSVLYAVEGSGDSFSLSEPGLISVNSEGFTYFKEEPGGPHRYLKVNAEQAGRLKDKFVEIISSKPKNLE